jgi:hypothetical protein
MRSNETNYLRRLTAVYAYEPILLNFYNELQNPCIQEVLLDLRDKVPNVRIVALKVLRSTIANLNDSVKQNIRSQVQSLCNDPDLDVKKLAAEITA